MSPILIAAVVFGGVYLLTRGTLSGIQAGAGDAGAGTVPVAGGARDPVNAPPGGDLGGVTNPPQIVIDSPSASTPPGPPVPAPTVAPKPCATCGGKQALPTPPRPPSHRPVVVDRRGLACVNPPCPTSPKSGLSNPRSSSDYIRGQFGKTPMLY